jgi:hypothetical protein
VRLELAKECEVGLDRRPDNGVWQTKRTATKTSAINDIGQRLNNITALGRDRQPGCAIAGGNHLSTISVEHISNSEDAGQVSQRRSGQQQGYVSIDPPLGLCFDVVPT